MTRAIVAQVLAVLVLAGCGKAHEAGRLHTEAQRLYDRHEYKAAAIQLRNALEANPFHRESQLLIGQVYLELDDPKSAEKELRKARQLNADTEKVVPLLARAFVLAREPRRVLDEIRVTPEMTPAGVAAVYAARGNALLALGQTKDAAVMFAEALKARPDDADALIGRARIEAAKPALEEALAIVEHALKVVPRSAEAWHLKGDVLRVATRNEDAAKAYSEALALRPHNLEARLSRAFSYIEAASYDAAQSDIDESLKRSPRHPLANYLQALTDFRQGDYAKARDHLAVTLKSAPDYMPAVLVSGAVELALGSTQRAEAELSRVVRRAPGDTYARKLLAFTYMRMGQPKVAVAVIAPALEANSRDPVLLGLAGEVYMRAGEFARAADLMQQAVAIDPKRAELYKGMGMLRAAKGDSKGAVAEFRQASVLDPEGRHGDFLLAATLLDSKRYDEALAAALDLAKKQPKNPIARHLAGSALLGKNDKAAARKNFEQALVLVPAYFPAAMALARLDVEVGNDSAARRRLESVLQQDKRNWQAMMGLASLAGREKKSKEAVDWLERARRASEKALPPRLLLARHYMEIGAAQSALAIAFEAEKANPGSVDALETLGMTQLATGDVINALASFQKLVGLAPSSAPALLRLASAQMAASKPVEAEQTIGKALALSPDSPDAKAALGHVLLRQSRIPEANQAARELQAREPALALGYALEGDVMLAQKRAVEAAAAYERAFEVSRKTAYLTRVYAAHALGGSPAKGEQRLLEWLAQNPKDVPVRNFLAEAYLTSGRNAHAAEQYQTLLKLAPDNTIVLNNLASVYLKLADRRALDTAQRAHRLKPDNPAILDTLGWVLVQTGDAKRGVPYLEQAAKAAPKSPEILYHLAVGLAKAGDKTRARGIAKQLMESGARLPPGDDPSKLLE